MRPYNSLIVGGVVLACLSAAITWYEVDPHAFVMYKLNYLQQLVSSSSRSGSRGPVFAFYKLSLQWPPSTCMSEPPKGLVCKGDIPDEFTIHGLWPQDANDKGIPPYNISNPCTNLQPVPPAEIISILQQNDTDKDLKRLWPNLKNSRNNKNNQDFWRKEWEKHGMCSDYPDKPLQYFKSALNLRKDFVKELRGNLTPGRDYKVKEVAEIVKSIVKKKLEIACSRAGDGETRRLLLWEVRLCYEKESMIRKDCPKDISDRRDCETVEDLISFPSPPQAI